MIRLFVIALVVVAVWYAGWQLLRYVKNRQVDWTGVTFAIGFVALAFYLRSVTGMG